MTQEEFVVQLSIYCGALCIKFRNAHTAKDDAEIERIDTELTEVERLIEFYRGLPEVTQE